MKMSLARAALAKKVSTFFKNPNPAITVLFPIKLQYKYTIFVKFRAISYKAKKEPPARGFSKQGAHLQGYEERM